MATRRVRVGVVGCGLIAQVMHLPYLRELAEQFEIAALCDLSPTVLARVGEMYGVPADRRFARWEDLIQAPLDAVQVLTSGSHAPVAIAAANLGRHVFVEKPMCFSAAEGREMIAAARAAGVRLMVGYPKRYNPAYERLLAELPGLDDLRMIQVTTLESPIPPYVAHLPLVRGTDVDPETLRRLQQDGDERIDRALGPVSALGRWAYQSVLLDSLVHEFSLLRGTFGEPERVDYADVRPASVSAVLTFPAAECNLTWVDLQDGIARWALELALYGPRKRLTLSFPSPFLRHAPAILGIEGGEPGSSRTWRTEETASYAEAFKRELAHFHDCIVYDREPRTPGEDGLGDVLLCEAVVRRYEERAGAAAMPQY